MPKDPARAVSAPAGRNRTGLDEHGFTLVELLVVITIIGVLTALAVPRIRGHVIDSRLSTAIPLLSEISSRQRQYFYDRGKYCCSGSGFDEGVLQTGLGVDTTESGDFCLAFVCRDTALCESTVSTTFIAPADTGDAAVEFEIWAVLRNSATGTVAGPESTTCTPASGKHPPSGWVDPANASGPARAGQVVVLRYPPPPNGPDSQTGVRSLTYVWLDGVSRTNAALP